MHISKIKLVIASFLVMISAGAPAFALGVAHAQNSMPTAENTRLAAAQLKACQSREAAIKNIMTRIVNRGQKQEDLFTKIATRTETFYTTKGKTLSNYDALVTDVNQKKLAVDIALAAVKTSEANFSCDGTNPKGVATAFKESLKLEISSLKDYRTSVKNLIVGVKSVQGTTSSSTNNGSTGGNQ